MLSADSQNLPSSITDELEHVLAFVIFVEVEICIMEIKQHTNDLLKKMIGHLRAFIYKIFIKAAEGVPIKSTEFLIRILMNT